MTQLLQNNSFFCILLTVGAFCIGSACQSRWKKAILNPILIGAALVMLTLSALKIPASDYQAACKPLSYLMTPATICLGISFAEQVRTLRPQLPAITLSVLLGTAASLGSIGALARVCGLDMVLTASLLPKSVTTAIGVVLSQQAGGIGAITTVAIILTGVLGNIAGPAMARLFRLTDPISRGVAYGTSAHVIGTSRAMEEGSLCGAVSSLSLTVAGILTSLAFSFLF